MSGRIDIFETAEADESMQTVIAEQFGDLQDFDRYDESNGKKYKHLIRTAREYVGQSFVAAALVSAWDGKITEDYDLDTNIANARNTAETVRGFRDFYEEHPTDEVGLHLGEYQLILFGTDGMKLGIHYSRESRNNAYMLISAPEQSNIDLHSGKLGERVQKSEDGAGSQLIAIDFNEIQTHVTPHFMSGPVEPLMLGRERIAEYFDWQAYIASVDGGSTHRLNSLAYGIWRLRNEDDALAAAINASTGKYGLYELWADQYRSEIGAKAAHVVLDKLQQAQSDTATTKERSLFPKKQYLTNVPGWQPEEPNIYGTEPAQYLAAAKAHAKRIGAVATDEELLGAVEHVFTPWWQKLDLDK